MTQPTVDFEHIIVRFKSPMSTFNVRLDLDLHPKDLSLD